MTVSRLTTNVTPTNAYEGTQLAEPTPQLDLPQRVDAPASVCALALAPRSVMVRFCLIAQLNRSKRQLEHWQQQVRNVSSRPCSLRMQLR